MRKAPKEPTDLVVLRALLKAARQAEQEHGPGVGNYCKVDVAEVAADAGLAKRDLVNRLDYHLNPIYLSKHGGNGPLTEYRQVDGTYVNLARVAALYANLSADDQRQRLTLWVALGAFLVSFAALFVGIFKPSEPVRVVIPASPILTAPRSIPTPQKAPTLPLKNAPSVRTSGAPSET